MCDFLAQVNHQCGGSSCLGTIPASATTRCHSTSPSSLAHLTGRTLVPYRFRLPRRAQVDVPPNCAVEPMLVPDLFDIPVRYSNEYLLKTWISVPGARQCVWAPLVASVLSFPATPADDVRFQWFRNGRPHVYTLSEEDEDAPDLHIYTEALGHYSYVFYLDDARRRQVVDLMRRMRPKRPYLSVADRIAASIGSFNAIHVRRGDFLRNELTKHKITRTTSVSGEEIVANLASRMHRDDPLVICTDGASSEEIFGPIRQYFRETIFLDRYLCESAKHSRDDRSAAPERRECHGAAHPTGGQQSPSLCGHAVQHLHRADPPVTGL